MNVVQLVDSDRLLVHRADLLAHFEGPVTTHVLQGLQSLIGCGFR